MTTLINFFDELPAMTKEERNQYYKDMLAPKSEVLRELAEATGMTIIDLPLAEHPDADMWGVPSLIREEGE